MKKTLHLFTQFSETLIFLKLQQFFKFLNKNKALYNKIIKKEHDFYDHCKNFYSKQE